ncbi:helix-turn-helix domain-containing protein [Pseudomonas cichorii]|nr:helix-turn-helix transcriptional regulator [Pseudomonas cichorii]MBX8540124.1 helix-turn-helix domain-containing protein [Pseudomonas cichorii]MBX8549647.1 helix-turn-helix domain-containing protein [Pseudomonas cichorii]MBX8567060.1 helix-turn-helix domain-containing protein [Pseudomonas cichorii]MBX8579694.1 helix-turn-helix domain-containing protein [Pseudomonas cichorii]MBX8583713.1 helix-turn-helix domain-containing protein [Pseudomonas cichorii]
MDYNVAFGTTFKRLRRLKRMTQEDFGSVVSERYVRMLEKGEYSPTLGTVADLAQVLQMSPVTLIALVQAEYLGLDAGKLLEEVLSEMQVFGGTDSTR